MTDSTKEKEDMASTNSTKNNSMKSDGEQSQTTQNSSADMKKKADK